MFSNILLAIAIPFLQPSSIKEAEEFCQPLYHPPPISNTSTPQDGMYQQVRKADGVYGRALPAAGDTSRPALLYRHMALKRGRHPQARGNTFLLAIPFVMNQDNKLRAVMRWRLEIKNAAGSWERPPTLMGCWPIWPALHFFRLLNIDPLRVKNHVLPKKWSRES